MKTTCLSLLAGAMALALAAPSSAVAQGGLGNPTVTPIAWTGQKLHPFTFVKFSNPSITNNGLVVFRVMVERKGQQVVKGLPLERILRRGMAVPGIPNTVFLLFSDPVVTDENDVTHHGMSGGTDRIAFIGVFGGTGVNSSNNMAIFSDRTGTWAPVARKGGAAWGGTPGQNLGANWGRFLSVAADGNVVAFTALLAPGAGVDASNDLGFWMSDIVGGIPSNRLVFREGSTVNVNGPRVVKNFQVLRANSLGRGQGFGLTQARALLRVTFVDRTQALLWVSADGTITTLTQTGITDVPGYQAGSKMKTFGVPSFSRTGYPAFRSGLFNGTGSVNSANNEAIISGHADTLQTLAIRSASAPGVAGAVFKKFGDPVMNEWGDVLFASRIVGGGATRLTDSGLWLNTWGTSQLFFREGDAAPSIAGTTMRGFPSAAITVYYVPFEYYQEPGMTQPLNGTDNGMMFYEGSPMVIVEGLLNRVGGVTTRNDNAVWATNWYGEKVLLIREGVTQFTVAGRVRTVKSFKVINPVLLSPTQKHSYNNLGEIVAAVSFTDRTHAVIKFKMPAPDYGPIR